MNFIQLISAVFIFTYSQYVFADELSDQILSTQSSCSGISDSMNDMKKMAGINTAITAVGTVASSVALGTGIAKANVDEERQKLIDKSKKTDVPIEKLEIADITQFRQDVSNAVEQASKDLNDQQKISDLEQKSKTLGKIRTGTLAGTAVMDTIGTIVAVNNKVDDDLQSRINNCVAEIKKLQKIKTQSNVENTSDSATIDKANLIINECRDWEYIDLSNINKKAKGAAISGGTGATLAIVGTITSASANSDSVRQNENNSKEKSLNTASNILAGGATGASAIATVFNAKQISVIKKAVKIADKCEEALK